MGVAVVRTSEVEREQTARRSRSVPATRRGGHRDAVTEASLDAPIVTVFRTPGGQVHHTRCHQPLEYHGRRAQLELDFYCLRCIEHVTLPEMVFPRIPVRMRFADV